MKIFRGDLVVDRFRDNVTISTLLPGWIYFWTPLTTKEELCMYVRAFDNPRWVNSFVRVEITIYWPSWTNDQTLLNIVWAVTNELIDYCWIARVPKVTDFGWYTIHSISNWPQIWPDRDFSKNIPVIKKDFIFYYKENGL